MKAVMKKMTFTITPKFLLWMTNSGKTHNRFGTGGGGKFIVGESKLRFLRNPAGDAGQLFRAELSERLDGKKVGIMIPI